MKNVLTIFFSILSIFTYAQEAAYYDVEQNADGKSNDWSNQELVSNNKYGFLTGVKNDEENLYLIFQSDNPRIISKAIMAGMTLTIKSKSKPKINAKIDYPLAEEAPRTASRNPQAAGNRANMLSPEEREEFMQERMKNLLESKVMGKFRGFTTTQGEFPVNSIRSMQLGLDIEAYNGGRTFNYELKIPLTELFGQTLDWKRMAKSELTFIFSVEGMARPNMNRPRPNNGRMRGAGARRPMRMNPASFPNGDMFSSQTVKFTYTVKK